MATSLLDNVSANIVGDFVVWFGGPPFPGYHAPDCTSIFARNIHTEQQEILKIANNKASSLGYDVSNMEIVYDFDNALFHKYRDPEDPAIENIDFQAIHYGPGDKATLGGGLIVVVDKSKKEVIWFQKGQ